MDVEPLSVKELFTTDDGIIRKARECISAVSNSTNLSVLVVVAAQFGQQVCGISPGKHWYGTYDLKSVMYFSTKILGPVFHDNSKLVALFVMAVGIPFNFVPGCLPQVSDVSMT